MNVYEQCPTLENNEFKIRLIKPDDADDLLKVYSDKNALPFFNSDNCNGSNFYCSKKEDMSNAIKYWLIEYHENKGFVRFSIIDQHSSEVIGTIEMFNRKSEDAFNNCGMLRLDVRSDYENADVLYKIISLFIEPFYNWFECVDIITKGALYAVERAKALEKLNFVKSEKPLIGHNANMPYYDYWVRHQK